MSLSFTWFKSSESIVGKRLARFNLIASGALISAVYACALATTVLVPLDANAQASQKVYLCKGDDSSAHWQTESCPPGTEIRTSQTIEGKNGLIENSQVSSPINMAPPAETVAASTPTAQQVTGDDAENSGKDVLKTGQLALLKTLAFGLVFGLIAKFMGRSFWGWFVVGVAVNIALVAANVISF